MEFQEKIKLILKDKGLSERKFAQSIGLNATVFNRNVLQNNLTGDMIKAIADNTDIDINWLVKNDVENPEEVTYVLNEPQTIYANNPIDKIDKIISELEKLKGEFIKR